MVAVKVPEIRCFCLCDLGSEHDLKHQHKLLKTYVAFCNCFNEFY